MSLRRQSIKEINNLIKVSHGSGQQDLINWMNQNSVFGILWDPRKTHLELVKQSKDIFNILAQKRLLTPELLEAFWNLGTDRAYKSEVFQILRSSSALSPNDLTWILGKIEATDPQLIGKEEFEVLAYNPKFKSRVGDVGQRSGAYFWRVLENPSDYKPDTVKACV